MATRDGQVLLVDEDGDQLVFELRGEVVSTYALQATLDAVGPMWEALVRVDNFTERYALVWDAIQSCRLDVDSGESGRTE